MRPGHSRRRPASRCDPLGLHPQPQPTTASTIGPLFVHAYGLAYVFAVAAAIFVTRWRWRKAGGDPDLAYEAAAVGIPGRADRRPDLLPDHHAEPDRAAQLLGHRSRSGTAGSGSGAGSSAGSSAGSTSCASGSPAPMSCGSWTRPRPALLVAQSIGRIGNYFNQELFGKPSTLPWALKISPAHRPPGYTQFATFQPSFLYEIIWNLLLAGVPDLARQPPQDQAAGAVRAVRRRLLGLPDLRGDDPDRLLRAHPRDAAELLDRDDRSASPGSRGSWRSRSAGSTIRCRSMGRSADARAFARRKPNAPYRKPPAPTYGKKSASGARPTSRSGGRRRGADP